MSALASSPMYKFCRALVSTNERARTLEPAFREKLRTLEERRAALGREKAPAIALAREWSHTFPDSGAPAEILAALPGDEAPALWLRAGALLALLLFLGSGAWLLGLALRGAPATVPAPANAPPPAPLTLSAPAPGTASPTVVAPAPDTLSTRAASPRPAPALAPRQGWIRVEADDDVKLLVDGEEVPRRDWSRIPADPGRRHIRLIKSGFLPIENVITVQAGKLAVVRAKGGG